MPDITVQSNASDLLFDLPMPLTQAFGLEGLVIGNDQATVRMPYTPAYTNSRGEVHGGAFSTLLDCTLASACRAHDPARYGVLTVDLTVHFLATARTAVIATATCERRGGSLSFARGQVHDEDGKLLALATGTFKLVERKLVNSSGQG